MWVIVLELLLVVMNCLTLTIHDNSNMLVDKIETNGEVGDLNNMMIEKFESDGDVRDRINMWWV